MKIYAKFGCVWGERQKLQWPMLQMIVVIGFCMRVDRDSPPIDVLCCLGSSSCCSSCCSSWKQQPLGCPSHHLHDHRLPACHMNGSHRMPMGKTRATGVPNMRIIFRAAGNRTTSMACPGVYEIGAEIVKICVCIYIESWVVKCVAVAPAMNE